MTTTQLEGEDLAALGEILTVLRTLSEESNLENPAAGPNAAELDKVTFIDYMKTAVKSEVSEIVARGFARAFFGVEPDEISMLFMVNYCKSGTGIDNLISDYKDGGQYLKARQGKGMEYFYTKSLIIGLQAWTQSRERWLKSCYQSRSISQAPWTQLNNRQASCVRFTRPLARSFGAKR